jgi:hypothetical protein
MRTKRKMEATMIVVHRVAASALPIVAIRATTRLLVEIKRIVTKMPIAAPITMTGTPFQLI